MSNLRSESVARLARPLSPALALLLALTPALDACQRRLESTRLTEEASDAVRTFAMECDEGVPTSCYALGLVYAMPTAEEQGITPDPAHALELLGLACDSGVAQACSARDAVAEGSSPGATRAPDGMNSVPEPGL